MLLTKKEVEKVFDILLKNNPNPRTELKYVNDYTLLVAVVLSAQSTDIMVNKVTKNLFAKVITPQQMLDLGLQQLIQYIKSIGLYNNKAKNIIALSSVLINKYNLIIPDNIEDLQELPGVGRKTANVILNVVFDKPTIAVDTHVFRVSKRIGLSSSAITLGVEKDLIKIIAKKFLKVAHNLLILHGRYICKANKPLCYKCSISKLCKFTNKSIIG